MLSTAVPGEQEGKERGWGRGERACHHTLRKEWPTSWPPLLQAASGASQATAHPYSMPRTKGRDLSISSVSLISPSLHSNSSLSAAHLCTRTVPLGQERGDGGLGSSQDAIRLGLGDLLLPEPSLPTAAATAAAGTYGPGGALGATPTLQVRGPAGTSVCNSAAAAG